jgi:hypothetical protein
MKRTEFNLPKQRQVSNQNVIRDIGLLKFEAQQIPEENEDEYQDFEQASKQATFKAKKSAKRYN